MDVYLVGGAVRDALLNLSIQERDWVVVGATPEDLLKQGYQPVGKDFPVFLHPETKEEYALARTERKVAPGYTGFVFNAAANVTLEDDLKRRDLTINAIAQTPTGELIDPYHGKDDLAAKILRHVSEAFAEDPVRILRVARFAARFPEFTVAPETQQLMKQMVNNGEINALVPERVWQELYKTLATTPAPWRFFEVLGECGAISIVFPQLIVNNAMQSALQHTDDPLIRFAILFYQNENCASLCETLRVPKEFSQLTLLVKQYLPLLQSLSTPDETLALLLKLDSFRRPYLLDHFIKAAQAINPQIPVDLLRQSFELANKITIKDIDAALTGAAIAEAINQQRLITIKKRFDTR